MEFVFLLIIILQLGYIIYKDRAFDAERERMYFKLLSKDISEYQSLVEEEPEELYEEEEELIVPIEEVSVEDILEAEDIR